MRILKLTAIVGLTAMLGLQAQSPKAKPASGNQAKSPLNHDDPIVIPDGSVRVIFGASDSPIAKKDPTVASTGMVRADAHDGDRKVRIYYETKPGLAVQQLANQTIRPNLNPAHVKEMTLGQTQQLHVYAHQGKSGQGFVELSPGNPELKIRRVSKPAGLGLLWYWVAESKTPSDFDTLYDLGLMQDSGYQNALGPNAREFNITAGSGPGKVRPGRVVVANSDGSTSDQFLIKQNCAVIIVCGASGCPAAPIVKSPCTYGGLLQQGPGGKIPNDKLQKTK